MRAYTATIQGQLTAGIETQVHNGIPVIELGEPRSPGLGQPHVLLDPNNPPDLDDRGVIHDGELVQIAEPDHVTGFLGYVIMKSVEERSERGLIFASTRGHRGSLVQSDVDDPTRLPKPRRLLAKAIGGHEGANTTQDRLWAEALHDLQPGEVVYLRKLDVKQGQNSGNAVLNIGGVIRMTTMNMLMHNRNEVKKLRAKR